MKSIQKVTKHQLSRKGKLRRMDLINRNSSKTASRAKKPFAEVETGLKSNYSHPNCQYRSEDRPKTALGWGERTFVNDPEADNLLRRDYRKPWKLS